ncbi:MAG TPA: hypothetical protein VG604_01615 [Candidatus Saccharimonadales bacterium]|nr:hypothetical protein [Candidatus Saccharimonadales bacterium]
MSAYSRLLSRAYTKGIFIAVVCLLVIAGLYSWIGRTPAYGANLAQRSLQLVDDSTGVTTSYQLSFSVVTAGMLGSVVAEFCSNDPLVGTPCTVPPGLDVSQAVIAQQNGLTGFTVSNASTTNKLILTRTPAAASPGAAYYKLNHVVNPNSAGSYYVRLYTYATDDASGPASDYGGIAFEISNSKVTITAEVPPYLIFCTGVTISGNNCANASGDFIDLGNLSPSHSSTGTSQMLVTTNAAGGYSVTSGGTTLSSGNNEIKALASGDLSRPGTAQFGLNLTSNSAPSVGHNPAGPGTGQPVSGYNQSNTFRFGDGDIIVANPKPDNTRVYTVSYLANVPSTQPPGVYVTTLTYVCLADF